jgi:hypothetical protein
MPQAGAAFRKGVFVSYSHKDEKWLKMLQTFLAPLVRNESVDLWDDTRIPPGAKWRDEINRALASTRVAVLLVSPAFLESKFIAKQELPQILASERQRGLTILWVPISLSLWSTTPVAEYQAVSDPAKPLNGMSQPERDKVFLRIAESIRAAGDLNAVANTLRILDEFVPQAEAVVEAEEAGGPALSVVARQQESTILFERQGQVLGKLGTITARDMDRLSPQSQALIHAHEAAMEHLFERWVEIYPKRTARVPEVRDKARRELEEVRKDLCYELREILAFLAWMGLRKIHDHYQHILAICSRPPRPD